MLRNWLKNKVILVTGGSGGIGNAIVDKLSFYEGNVVAVYYRNPPADPLSDRISWIQADLTNATNIERLIKFTLRKYGKIDVLINSAGYLEPGEFSELEVNHLKKMIDVNLTSTLIITTKILAVMKTQGFGHIINIGSLGGIVPMPYSAVYCAAKFAIRGFSFSLSEEFRGTGISLSLITPASVATRMLDHEASDKSTAIAFVGNPLSPIDTAEAVLKVILKPQVEVIIPRFKSLGSKLLTFSPVLFHRIYRRFHKIGLAGKKKYTNRNRNYPLYQGDVR